MAGAAPSVKLLTWQYTQRQLQALLVLKLMPKDKPPALLDNTG